jgi:hypothetical protein
MIIKDIYGEIEGFLYTIIPGDVARKEGLYKYGQFILEESETFYDSGYWFLPEDGGYAEWWQNLGDGFADIMTKAKGEEIIGFKLYEGGTNELHRSC